MAKLIHPIDKVYLTQLFGENPKMYAKFGMKGHNGIDYRTKFADSPLGRRYVVAVADGVIEETRDDTSGYGTHLRQRLNDGTLVIYGHLTKYYVSKKQIVKQGERIALTGNTGFSTGPHLHFEVRPKGTSAKNGYFGAEDPLKFLPKV